MSPDQRAKAVARLTNQMAEMADEPEEDSRDLPVIHPAQPIDLERILSKFARDLGR